MEELLKKIEELENRVKELEKIVAEIDENNFDFINYVVNCYAERFPKDM